MFLCNQKDVVALLLGAICKSSCLGGKEQELNAFRGEVEGVHVPWTQKRAAVDAVGFCTSSLQRRAKQMAGNHSYQDVTGPRLLGTFHPTEHLLQSTTASVFQVSRSQPQSHYTDPRMRVDRVYSSAHHSFWRGEWHAGKRIVSQLFLPCGR